MERIVRLLLLLSGLCSLPSCVSRHQYFFVNTPRTWYEAQSYCREKCFDLATIDNMEEMGAALKAVEASYNGPVWTGLRGGKIQCWHQTLANIDMMQGKIYLVLDKCNLSNCAAYNNTLYAFDCSTNMYSICFNGTKHGLDEYVLITKNKTCSAKMYSICFNGTKHGLDDYVLITENMTWTVALDYCRVNRTDLRMTSIGNETESQAVQNVAGGLFVWTGFFKDSWEWSDSTNSSFRYWDTNQPVFITPAEGSCSALLMNASGRWVVLPCEDAHPFLCNCPSVSFTKLRISTQDLMDANDPAVYNDLLNQIKQRLRNISGTDASKIQWKKHPDGRVFKKEPNGCG